MSAFRSRRGFALAGALALLALAPAGTLAYTHEVNANVVVTNPGGGLIKCESQILLEATVLGPSGTGNPDVTVTWTITDAPGDATDELASATSVTDAEGVAENWITLECIVGSRTVTASAPGGAVGSITIVLTSRGLPNTATLPGTAVEGPPMLMGFLLLLGIVGLGSGLALRRRRG